MPIVVHGVSASPFVRKVRALLEEKGVAYESKPTFGDKSPEWKRKSPLGKVPVLEDDGTTIPDSSVICLYLEKRHPEPPLIPSDPAAFARALWFEEWADTALAQVAGGKIFFPRVVGPRLMNKPADEAAVETTIREELPPLFDYLEGEISGPYLVADRLTIADLAVATHFVNLAHAGVQVDASRWPKLAEYLKKILARPSFEKLIAEDRKLFG